MSNQSIKRVTLDLTPTRHRILKEGSKKLGLTQQECLSLIVDLTMTNPETIRKHAEQYLKKKAAEEKAEQELQDKAKRLVSQLSPEQIAKLLAGEATV